MSSRNPLLSVLIICVLAPVASAQETDPAEAVTKLEEIVVIAAGSRAEAHGFPRAGVPHQIKRHADHGTTRSGPGHPAVDPLV